MSLKVLLFVSTNKATHEQTNKLLTDRAITLRLPRELQLFKGDQNMLAIGYLSEATNQYIDLLNYLNTRQIVFLKCVVLCNSCVILLFQDQAGRKRYLVELEDSAAELSEQIKHFETEYMAKVDKYVYLATV